MPAISKIKEKSIHTASLIKFPEPIRNYYFNDADYQAAVNRIALRRAEYIKTKKRFIMESAQKVEDKDMMESCSMA